MPGVNARRPPLDNESARRSAHVYRQDELESQLDSNIEAG